jgi:hypothetical protein
MTNKEQAQALWAIMSNAQNDLNTREVAMAGLLDVKKTSKSGWEKLGINKQVFEDEQQALISAVITAGAPDPLAEPVQAPEFKGPTAEKVWVKSLTRIKPTGDQRGLISAKVRCLLMDTSDSYKLIVEAVKAEFPDANTTTRSVASVAAELRKCGQTIAFRRPTKGA